MLIAFIKDIRQSVCFWNECIQANEKQVELMQQLCDISQFHSDAKKLSNFHETWKKFLQQTFHVN